MTNPLFDHIPDAGWTVKRYRDPSRAADYLHIRFPLSGGGEGTLQLSMAMTANPSDVMKELLKKGAALPREKSQRSQLVDRIIAAIPDCAGVLATSTGWHGQSFLLGDQLVGEADVVLDPDCHRSALPLSRKSGTLSGWKSKVAEAATESSYASFAIMHALAAPLMIFSDLPEGAIFHFAAPSSVGKTTAIKAGASVWGDPSKPTDWNGSERGLQELAAMRSDIQLILDDTERMRQGRSRLKTSTRIAHVLTSGESDQYSGAVAGLLKPMKWRCLAISTGPWRIDEEFTRAGQSRSPGDRVRLIDIPVPDAADGGIWDRCPDLSSAERAVLSERLARSCDRHHGHLFHDWISHLVKYQDEMERHVRDLATRFLENVLPEDVGGVERRIAQKFALVYAAGKLAVREGFLPWDQSHPFRVCKQLCLKSLGRQEGKVHAAARRRLLKKVQALAGDQGLPQFTAGKTPEFPKGTNVRGYVRVDDQGKKTLFARYDELDRLFGTHTAELFRELQNAGAIQPGQGARTGKQMRVKVGGGLRKCRFVTLDVSALRHMIRDMR